LTGREGPVRMARSYLAKHCKCIHAKDLDNKTAVLGHV